MKAYGVNELRKMFLEFFESKEHLAMKSFSLVPHNDKSLLLINSGMAPLKPYFTGQEIPPRKRVTTCQKCIRTGDIDNVGKTARHGTFFEMLGNFSFGDYFKLDAIKWSWEFLTEVVGLDADRLYPSIYEEDDEAFEIWNNVFTQFDNDGEGHYTELEQKNIDTGMGLERLASVVQDVDSIFDVDTIKALRDHVCSLAAAEYGKNYDSDVSIRVITDHVRSVTFMISDGIMPSNEGRGYVLRRLLRRACRHGRLLGIQGEFLPQLSETVITGSKDGYPELEEKKEFILKVIAKEEEQFNKTIDQGLGILKEMEKEMQEKGEKTLSGADAFKLYDTYGFPLDLTKEILEEKGLAVDEDGFKAAMEEQRVKARTAREVTNYMGADATVYDEIAAEVTSVFVGYDKLAHESKVTVVTTETEVAEALSDGQAGTIFVEETPFYATSGGQEADKGLIKTAEGVFEVEDTIKLRGGKIGHVGKMRSGMIKTGDTVILEVDSERRSLGARNHSATHLLQKALRTVLGTHVEQAGSLNNADRLRFDFTHFSAMSADEIKQTENLVNKAIAEAFPVVIKEMPIEEARKTGAQALFGEKYGDVVRVVNMGDYSVELCGGTHVKNTSEIAAFKILSETGVAAGVRRIEALTSKGLMKYYDELEKKLHEAAKLLKATPDNLTDKITHLQADNKALHSEVESLKSKLAKDAMGDVMNQVKEVNGMKLLAIKVEGVDMNGLRDLGDQLKEKIGEGVVVIASVNDGKVNLMAAATEDAVKKGAHAGNLIKGIAGCVGGGGGGRPNMAQAGGKNPAGIEEALAKAEELLKGQV